MKDFGAMEASDIVQFNYGSHTPIDLRTAEILISNFGGYGQTRVYGTFRDGVYKGQIVSIKSDTMLQEYITAYNMDLTACTRRDNNIIIAKVK